jgi:hypothetical protein
VLLVQVVAVVEVFHLPQPEQVGQVVAVLEVQHLQQPQRAL